MIKNKYIYLNDATFLKTVDNLHLKEYYAKITILNWNEDPIQEIQGIVTGGNINLDGNSTIRRTCNLSMIIQNDIENITNINNLISINKKLYLEIGYKNTTKYYQEYEMLWFPQGVFVVISPSISHSTGGTTINLQLKDKMCLLNGECGGIIPASTQFDQYETLDENGKYIISKPTIYQIIQELVNHFGGEQLGKIIISDIDLRIKTVMKWIGSSPVYLLNADSITNDIVLTTNETEAQAAESYTMFENGRDIGYIYTDFYYPSELIGDAGSSVCDILDKIKNTLGNYEYFYDIEGNFIFQEKKNYLNTSHSTIELDKINNSDYLVDMSKGKTVYEFSDGNLITSYSNTPKYSMIKNDFIVWGIKKNDNGNTTPIRYHLAIDSKPKTGNTYKVVFWEDPDDGLLKAKVPINFVSKENFPKTGMVGVLYYSAENEKIYKWDTTLDTPDYVEIEETFSEITTSDWRDELYLSGAQTEYSGLDSNYYYTELVNEWPRLYDTKNGTFYQNILDTPSDCDFYLDFIDSNAAVSQFSISNIGRRTKVINDNNINCIFEPNIPDFILIEKGLDNTEALRKEAERKGQSYIQLDSEIYSMLSIGGSKNSAYEMIKNILYEYTSYNESITIQSLPIYYLEPNTRISVRDIESNIYGDYIISTISLPLDINGTMSISATRALEKI